VCLSRPSAHRVRRRRPRTHHDLGSDEFAGKSVLPSIKSPRTPIPSTAETGTVVINWSAPATSADGSRGSKLTGFRIYYGTAHTTYTKTIDVDEPSALTYTIRGLAPGTYYIVVSAIDSNNNESLPSPEIGKVVE
jgi:fibronectin type III domain protein